MVTVGGSSSNPSRIRFAAKHVAASVVVIACLVPCLDKPGVAPLSLLADAFAPTATTPFSRGGGHDKIVTSGGRSGSRDGDVATFASFCCAATRRLSFVRTSSSGLKLSEVIIDLGDDDDDEGDGEDEEEVEDEDEEEEEEDDPYNQLAKSEFSNSTPSDVDWGGALGTLRERVGDIKQGKTGPSNALFRMLTKDAPNEAIMNFVQEAKPDVVSAMSGAVGSLLGGLSNPALGVETIVKADGEKLGNLCFQLQMTGYMFRNAEYVLALKDLMNLEVTAELSHYKEAFDKLDKDKSGYIEASEIEALLADVYEGSPPKFEVETFLRFFDTNRDGKVSWEEFERGLGTAAQRRWNNFSDSMERLALPGDKSRDDIEDEDDDHDIEHAMMGGTTEEIEGLIEVELEDGKVIEVEAKDYIQGLRAEAEALKEALRQEMLGQQPQQQQPGTLAGGAPMDPRPDVGGIAQYISKLGEKNLKKLTEGISPDVVDAMKLLIDFVLDRGQSKSGTKKMDKKEEMEIAGSALQQLALWQLVLGYRLREQEATGEWRKMLDD